MKYFHQQIYIHLLKKKRELLRLFLISILLNSFLLLYYPKSSIKTVRLERRTASEKEVLPMSHHILRIIFFASVNLEANSVAANSTFLRKWREDTKEEDPHNELIHF